EDRNHGAGAVFHELDEAFIGLLVRGVVVALGGRVSHFTMVSHRFLQRDCSNCLGINSIGVGGQRRIRDNRRRTAAKNKASRGGWPGRANRQHPFNGKALHYGSNPCIAASSRPPGPLPAGGAGGGGRPRASRTFLIEPFA